MKQIYLVTHPEAQHHLDNIVGGWHDSELTSKGHQQAECIAQVLADRINDEDVEVFSSDLARASQTAARIASRFNAEVRLDARLRERSSGVADGRPKSWLAQHRIPLPEHGDRLGHHDGPEGAETRWELVQRLYPALDEIISRPARTQIVVSHGSASSYLIAAFIGMPMASTDRVFFRLTSGGITTLLLDDRFSHQVVALNETSQLEMIT